MRFRVHLAAFLAMVPGVVLAQQQLNIVPWPQSIVTNGGSLTITSSSQIVAADPALLPLGIIASNEVSELFGLNLNVVQGTPAAGDIQLAFTTVPSITNEAYRLTVDTGVTVEAQNYNAVAMGTVTFLQSLSPAGGNVSLPRMVINDSPAKGYRALSTDIKHNWHPVSTLKNFIVICRWYKIRYLSLHTGEPQWMAAVCDSTTNYTKAQRTAQLIYTPAEMQDIIAFGAARGVTLVPHNESIPTESGIDVITNYTQEVTGAPFTDTNIFSASSQYWATMSNLTARACAQFSGSPFYHVGPIGGEVPGFGGTPAEQAFMAAKGMRNSNDYYRWLALQMRSLVGAAGKRLQSWEGIYRDTSSPFQVPTDVIFMHYTHGYYDPQTMVNDGYSTVDCGWTPLYIVGTSCYPVSMLYAWNCYDFGPETPYPGDTFGGYTVVTSNQQNVLGGELCTWETPEAYHTDLLRTNVPALAERVWNPASGLSLSNFLARWQATDSLLPALFIPPDSIDVSGNIDNPNTGVGSGNLANLVGDTTFGWQMGDCGIPVRLNGFTFTMDSGGGNAMNYIGTISGTGVVKLVGTGYTSGNWNNLVRIGGTAGNTYTGTTLVTDGSISLEKSSGDALRGAITVGTTSDTVRLIWTAGNQINDASDVTLVFCNIDTNTYAGRTTYLDLAGFPETFNSLTLSAGTKVKTGLGTNGLLRVNKLVLGSTTNTTGAFGSSTPGDYVEGGGYILVGGTPPPVLTNPPAIPSSPVPTNNATGVTPLNPTLSWADSQWAASYDLYFWLATGTKPATPTATLTSAAYTPANVLSNAAVYKWQVVANNAVGSTPGLVWTFTTKNRGDVSGEIDNPNSVIGAGNTANLLGDTIFGWQTGNCGIPVTNNGYNFTLNSGGGNPLNYTGYITGSGGLTLQGAAYWGGTWNNPIQLGGSVPNTYTGPTIVVPGTVWLQKTSSNALCGTITVGSHSDTARLVWFGNNQISDTSDVTLLYFNPGSGYPATNANFLSLNGYSDKIRSLTLETGTYVDTGAGGVLTVASLTVGGVVQAGGTYTSTSSFVKGSGSILVVPPKAPPQFPVSGFSRPGGVPTFVFPTVFGNQYRLVYKDKLTDASWTAVGTTWASGTGGNVTLSDSGAVGKAQRFYRLQVQ